jgi:integrase
MATPKVTQRKVNAGIEQPVYIRYSYPEPSGKNKDYFAPVGISIAPALLKDGRVVGDLAAPELNAKIQAVLSRMEQAIRSASSGGRKPYANAVKAEFKFWKDVAPKASRLVAELKALDKSEVETLQYEIEELLSQVEEKRAKIVEVQKRLGTYQPELLSTLIDDYIKHRNSLKPKNTEKRAKKSFSTSTQSQYMQLKIQLQKFNPTLSIRTIDKAMMEQIESYFVGERYYNSSTFTLINKLLTVLNHYQPLYSLSKSYKDYSFELKMRDESIIYLTTEELRAFRHVSTAHKHPLAQKAADKVKDLALLMSESALRYSDSAVTRSDIKNGYIVKDQKKTGGAVYIPFTARLQAICEKYDYKLKGGKIDNFNATLRRLLSSLPVPSLRMETTVTNYIGTEKVEDTRPKFAHCGAHTLRRTMINQMLLRGKRYDQITKVTGHKDFETFQTYVDRDIKVAEMDEVFDFLNEPEQAPVMRVA